MRLLELLKLLSCKPRSNKFALNRRGRLCRLHHAVVDVCAYYTMPSWMSVPITSRKDAFDGFIIHVKFGCLE